MVVGNTSPILNLARIGRVDLLGQLYGAVTIPDAVDKELRVASGGRFASLVASLSCVTVRPVSDRSRVESLLNHLDWGESEAIALALEVRPRLLLIDEHRGRQVAERSGLRCVGILGALLAAKHRSLIPAVRPLLDALVEQAGFWVRPALRERVLELAGE